MAFELNKINLESLIPEAIENPLQSTMTEAVKVNPDSQIKLKKLSRDSGMPVEAVKTNPESVESSLNLSKIDFESMTKRSPNTAKYLTNFDNASIAHDDHEILSKLEDTLKIIPAAATQATLGVSGMIFGAPRAADRIVGAVAKSIEDVTGLPRNLNPIRGIQDIVGFISEGRLPGDIDLGLAGTTEVANRISDVTKKLAENPEIFPEAFQRLAVKGQEADAAFNDALKGDFVKLGGVLSDPEALAGFLAQAAPSLVMAYMSGGSLPFIAWMEGMEAANSAAEFERSTGQKMTDAQFMQATTQASLIGAKMEKFGFGKVVGAKGKGLSGIIDATLSEKVTEMGQAFNANVAEWIAYNRDKDLREGILPAGIGGFGAGFTVSTATVVLDSLATRNQRLNSQQKIEQQSIDSTNENAEKSKLKERDKESFREFTQSVNDNADVFIDGVQTSLYLQKKTDEEIQADPALALLQKKADEAAALGVDVTVSVADFTTDVVGTESYDALREHMKLSPETSTPFRQEQEQTEQENYIKTMMDTASENVSEYAEAQDIFITVKDQLIDTGRMTTQQADMMAQVVPAWATVQALDRGIPVKQVYEESGLGVEGPLTGEAARLVAEAEGVLRQAPTTAPTFFSKLRNVITEKMSRKASGQDVLNLIKKEGVKAEEIKWSGVEEFLKEKKTATKDEVLEFLAANQIEVSTDIKESEIANITEDFFDRIDIDEDAEDVTDAWSLVNAEEFGDFEYVTVEEFTEEDGTTTIEANISGNVLYSEKGTFRDFLDWFNEKYKPTTGKTKFSEYTLPGGENYKELLLTLPVSPSEEAVNLADEIEQERDEHGESPRFWRLVQQQNEPGASVIDKEDMKRSFISTHFDEPNILAHVRFNERTDAEGNKVLFLEEVQSDWALEARKKGVDVTPEKKKQLEKRKLEIEELGRKATNEQKDEWVDIMNELQPEVQKVPAAPFIQKNWHELALKRMLRYAAENNFDSVAWITGQQTADRYDLSKQVDEIRYERLDGGLYDVEIITPNELPVIHRWSENDLERYVGKDVAKKMAEGQGTEDESLGEGVKALEGEDLKVGGEWAFTLYDKVIPNFLKKYGKKWGAKVEDTQIETIPGRFAGRGEETTQQSIPITDEMKQAVLEVGQPLFQAPQDGKAKGYYDPANSMIRLTESSDLSTFLHEFAHFMYDMELKNPDSVRTEKIHNWFKRNAEDVAQEANGFVGKEGALEQPEIPTAPEGTGNITAADVTAYLDNKTSGDKVKDSAIERAVHEQFARGFETYLMEGKAPSMELRNVFRAFARWLTQIYKSIRGDLKVNLDKEMRQVFDRLLATEEQIAMAEARAQFEPMFTDAAMAGMDEEEFRKYQEKQSKTKDKSTETLRDKLIKELTRQQEKWWKEEKADIVDEEIERLSKEKVYVAKDTLLTGTFKLDRPTVKEMHGEKRTDKLGRKTIRIPEALRNMTAEGGEGVHPDEAAGFLGYISGDELVQALINAPNIKVKAAENAEQIMLDKHGDIMNDGTIEKEADEAVQNEERGELILTELKVLSKDTGRAVIERQMLKTMAEENIGKLSFRNVHPGKYRKAEIRAAQEAATALATGNKEEAATAKARQAMNFYLGKAATEAKNNIIKIVDQKARYKKKSVREAIMKAEGGYWEQLTKILTRFEFRKGATLGQVDRLNENIAVWAKERIEQDGDGLTLSPEILDEGYVTHWKNVPYDALQGVNDSVKNIEHVARYSNKITRQQEEMTFQKLVQKWTDSMNEKVTSRFPTVASVADKPSKAVKWGRWFMAQMTKIPYLASWLDGQERAGISHDILVQPFTDAYNEELKLWDETGTPVMEAIQNRSKEDIKRHNSKIFIPEIEGLVGHTGNLMGHEVLAIALNSGNESNLKKLLLGEGWANPDIEAEISIENPKLQAVLTHMTKSDWDMVQLIWDQMELLYPQLAEVHRKTTGLTPPKIESTPIKTKFGTFKGGYYPVKYDPNRSFRAQQNEDRLNAETESMFGRVGIQASVNASATSERTGVYGPIRLSLDIIPNHFQETIHYITHHDAVRETNKLIKNESVANTIKEKLGPEEYAQLKPWLNDIAKDGREAPLNTFIGSILQRLRFGTTLGVMGFKASTGIIQILGLSNTIAEVGSAPVYQAIRSILGSTTDMQTAWDFAVDNSKVMAHRVNTMDREIKNAMHKLEGKRGILAAVQEASMKHIALMQTFVVDLPSWHAAYIKGMKDWGDEKRSYAYADWVIENIQGSGVTKDMAQIMRDQNQAMRMFTMFMTFFSSLWGQERDLVKGARAGTYSRTTVAAKLMFLFTIPVFLEMLLRGEFGDDDDDESKLQKYLTQTALYPVQSIPGIRDFASGAAGEFGYNISPIAQILEGGVNALKEIPVRAFTDDEITKGQVKGATKFIGAAVGIPGINQAWATGEHLYNVLEEGEELTLNQLLYGPRR